jgi:hypothetical protein
MRKLALTFAIAAFALAIGPPAVAATPSYHCVASARSDTTTPNLVAVQATDAAIATIPTQIANRRTSITRRLSLPVPARCTIIRRTSIA